MEVECVFVSSFEKKNIEKLGFEFLLNSTLDIADVTNFVHHGTALDNEASQRGTSVYLVERRIDMLPKPLTEGITSFLVSEVDGWFSVMFTLENFLAKIMQNDII